MLFSSLFFLYGYLPLVLLIYYCSPKRYRNGCLFLVSLVFYGWQEPIYIFIMIISIVVNYIIGRLIAHYHQQKQHAHRFIIAAMLFNIALLGFFKYYNFIVENLQHLFHVSMFPTLTITLPIGISFYTFQTMSYPIDVYRKEVQVQKNFVAFATYVTMFPQLVAGPIVRYKDVAFQLVNRSYSNALFYRGILRFLCGLSKKVLIANPLGSIWLSVMNTPIAERSILMCWIGIIAFSMQLYFDFSGYSDMAIGLGRMIGFRLPENFHYPYISRSIREFWHRWHMTLGTWFREYVYIPLGGSRNGLKKTIRNLLIVWLLTGIWHGAGWNFLIWGLYCGCFIILEKLVLHSFLQQHKIISHVYFLLVITIGWVFFASDNLSEAMIYLKTMFALHNVPLANDYTWYILGSNIVLLLFAIFFATPYVYHRYQKYHEHRLVLLSIPLVTTLLLLLCSASLAADTYNPFLYFRF